jgi:hypothetical protein
VELNIVKNGDFFNLAKDDDAIILISKEKSVEETPSQIQNIGVGAKPDTPIKSYSGYKEDPDKQAAIIRQNALTNATNLVISTGVTNVDSAIKYIISVAIQFAKFTSGEDMTEYLLEESGPFEPKSTEVVKVKRGPKAKDKSVEEIYHEETHGEFGE